MFSVLSSLLVLRYTGFGPSVGTTGELIFIKILTEQYIKTHELIKCERILSAPYQYAKMLAVYDAGVRLY